MTEPAHVIDTPLTRRRLVQAGGAATAALYLGGLTGTATAAGVPSYLQRSAYPGLANASFAAVTDSGLTTTLRLTDVADLVRARSEPSFAGRDDAFTLLFSGSRDAVLDSGIHELRHPSLGAFSVFITPIESAAEQHYEVVVDRSVRLASAVAQAPEPMALSNAAPAATAAAVPSGAAAPAAPAAPAAAGAPKATASPKSTKQKSTKQKSTKQKSTKQKSTKLVQSATIARRGGVLSADVRVAAGRGIVSVRAVLLRDGTEYARAARMLRGKVGVRLALRELRRTPTGSYELRVTVRDRHGTRTRTLRRVTVR